MIYNLIVNLDEIASAIGHAFRWLIAGIATLIYDMIIFAYELFEYIARAEIINNAFVQEIYRKVGLILGLFMTFKLMFSLIQALIEPSKLNDKKNGYAAILVRSIVSIILLGFTPFIFREAYDIQSILIGNGRGTNNVLYKLVIGTANINSESLGRELAAEAYFAFFRDDEHPFLDNAQNTVEDNLYFKSKIEQLRHEVVQNGKSFSVAQEYLNKTTNNTYVVEYNELLSLAFGVIILWMIIMYCIQTAVRVFQLAYLQIIAPVPILSYISDSEGMFKKWVNQCVSTYLDLFIRLMIIYFVVYLTNHITKLFDDNNSILANSTGLSQGSFMWWLLEMLLLVGLLIFAGKLPDLLKDLMPNILGAGKFSFGLNPKKNVWEPLKSSPITKGVATTLKPVAHTWKKFSKGMDSYRNGYGFREGWRSEKGAFGKWYDKHQQEYSPYSYEKKKNGVTGIKEVKEIDNKWNKGLEIVNKLGEKGLNMYSETDPNAWNKALNGTKRENYEIIFKNEAFINSKMNLDSAKKELDDLRDALVQVQSGGEFIYKGVTYNMANAAELSKLYNSQSNAVSGLEAVHASVRKQYDEDARVEDAYKFIKNNMSNPANPQQTHMTAGIREVEGYEVPEELRDQGDSES